MRFEMCQLCGCLRYASWQHCQQLYHYHKARARHRRCGQVLPSPVPLPPELVAERPDGLPLQDHLVPLGEGPVAAALGDVRLQAGV